MRFALLLSVALCASVGGVVAVGCSSSDDTSSGGGDYTPKGNGQPVNEKDACDALRAAEDARQSALSCGPTTKPACPGYISAGHDACSQYDQGALSACIDWVGKQSCDGLKKHKCIVAVLPGTAPNGCPMASDGGPDAPEDTGSDAEPDSGSDASEDTGSDAEPDSGSDAAEDTGSD